MLALVITMIIRCLKQIWFLGPTKLTLQDMKQLEGMILGHFWVKNRK